ncbi:MAG TPA: aldehyde dehydrogenase family protein [Microlunatus sp.]|nr:aldehyde dehydrogenase family protein [Microlunatus sp.]
MEDLRAGAEQFNRTAPAARAQLVRECLDSMRPLVAEWSRHGLAAKHLPSDSGEEWFAGPVPVLVHLHDLADSLDQIAVNGRPALGTGVRHRSDGRLEVLVHPASRFDRVLMSGVQAHVLLRSGIDQDAAVDAQAGLYQRDTAEPSLAVVLAAGNVSSLPITDVLAQLFNEGRVCLLKMNPVNEWFGPLLERALRPLLDAGFVRVVYGGADVGSYLTEHPDVDWVHLTGSAATHDQLLWGPPGPDREARRSGELPPLISVPVSAELGNITPVAVVPDAYEPAELAFQARNVATMVTNNASFNCLSARMLVTAKGWPQREQFLRLVMRYLAGTPTRYAYYPGAHERFHRFTEGREVRSVGDAGPEELPWTLVPDLDSSDPDEPLFRLEPFCCLLSEVPIDAHDPVEFLQRAIRFMNEVLWGTLCAAIVISPRLERDPVIAGALDHAVTDLRYGNVAINAWPALNVSLARLPWGGHVDGRGPETQSGNGLVKNTLMLGAVDKGVLRAGLTVRPTPPWFSDNPKGGRVAPAFADVVARRRWRQLPGLMVRML